MSITHNFQKIRNEVSPEVKIVLAAKRRTADEILEAMAAGATHFGQNYIQEAEQIYAQLGDRNQKVHWHLIGEVQRNKINKALAIFDTFQTIDSTEKAKAVNLRAQRIDKKIEVYLEINSAGENTKNGLPADFEIIAETARYVAQCSHLKLTGLMTMGAFLANPEDMRPFFRKTKIVFDQLKALQIPDTNLQTLSMGMSDSYRIAIEEGANMIRLGTIIFGPRL